MYVVRIKAVSLCMGIRRSNLIYTILEDKEIDFNFGHPMSKFKNGILNKDYLEINNEKQSLLIGEEVYWYKNNDVESLGKIETEKLVLGAMILELDSDMINYYEDAIKNGYIFDAWHGEFEYLLALLYDKGMNNKDLASSYYKMASDKGFKFKLV